MVTDFSDLSSRVKVPSKKRTISQINACIRLAIWICLCVSLAIVAVCATAYLVNSALFEVKRIEITGASHVTTDEAMALLGIEKGDNILTWDMNEARKRLESHPWIRELSISRSVVPASVHVRIREHRPMATLVLEGRPYLLSEEGVPFVDAPGETTGFVIRAENCTKGDMRQGLQAVVKNVLGWARLASGMGLKPREMVVGPAGLADVRLENGLWITVFGKPNRRVMNRALKVMAELKPPPGTIMDLRCDDKIVLRTREAHGDEG